MNWWFLNKIAFTFSCTCWSSSIAKRSERNSFIWIHDCFNVVKIIYRIARDPRFKRLPCLHKGTYADDCIVQRITQVNTHNHIVSEFWITLWINFELFEYLVGINWYDFTCTLLYYSTNVTLLPHVIKIWGEESERSQGYPSCTCNNTGKFNILYFLI